VKDASGIWILWFAVAYLILRFAGDPERFIAAFGALCRS